MPWKQVTIDFIMKLPKSKDPLTNQPYDAILVMVDRLIKYAHMVLFKKTYNAKQLGYIVLDQLIQYHGMSKAYISDRDKLITSNY